MLIYEIFVICILCEFVQNFINKIIYYFTVMSFYIIIKRKKHIFQNKTFQKHYNITLFS